VKHRAAGRLPSPLPMPTATSPTPRLIRARPRPLAEARRWAFVLVALALAALVSSPAQAAVPMCGEDGQTVAAPPMILPWRMLKLEAPAPCPPESHTFALSFADHQPRGPSSPPAPAPLRAVPIRASDLPEPPATREPIFSLDQPKGCELVSTVYRPPRH
jgi:hypothetical protein